MTTIHSQKQEKQTQNMENEVRQRKPIPFLEDWRRNDVEMKFEECLGQFQLRKKWGKTVNSHKKSREKLKKFKETVFETQNMRFSQLKQVANKSLGQAAKTLKVKIVKKFLSVFCDWKVYPRGSRELSCENLCVPLATGPFTHEQVAKINTQARSCSMRLR